MILARNLRVIENHYYGASPEIIARARILRQSMTPAEQLLWSAVRRKQLNGVRFRRQHPIAQFVVDFYCHQAGLVIELDGEIHAQADQQQRDNDRTYELERLGLRVIRFQNEEILNNISGILVRISNELSHI